MTAATDIIRPIPRLTAITGGIGSGKSVVARIVKVLGYDVYDCDRRAKTLMTGEDIKTALAATFGKGIFDTDGNLVSKALAAIVFSDPDKLRQLNAITHSAVRDDLRQWATRHYSEETRCFVETAILYQSGIDLMVGNVWEVTAPRELRIDRVGQRNALSRDEIMARIEAQDSFIPEKLHEHISVIINDGITPLLPQIEYLLANDL